ncbi:tape measure domain-containing protein [Lipingzhangella halophila]|uniref:Tape measure domain-containing protein n=1 Tax=Lipingzhangella halophila TaxID=1783352 RepID=A0A7W7RG73_9ACTN|nr:tape measure protein [Lipingzhangella halophila]MBB4931404.1 tape measure domain-containing protein [Lipingzhangella halophila]
MAVLEELTVKIDADLRDFTRQMKRATRDVDKMLRGLESTSRRAGRSAGDGFTSGFGTTTQRGMGRAITGAEKKLRGSRDRFATVGRVSGQSFTSGFERSTVQAMGETGRRAGDRFSRGVNAGTAAAATGFSRVQNQAGQTEGAVAGVGTSFRDMATVATGALAAIGIGRFAAAVGGLTTSIQDTTAALSGMYGDARLAERTVNDINDAFRTATIGTEVFHDAALELGYLGVQGDDTVEILENINTSIGHLSNGPGRVNSITSALAKAQGQGNAFNGELNMISEAGFPILEELAAHLDTTTGEIKTMASEGQISYEDLLAVLGDPTEEAFGRAQRAAEETEKTFTGEFNAAKNNVTLAAAEMVSPFLDDLAPAVGKVGERAVEVFSEDIPRIVSNAKDTLESTGADEVFTDISSAMWSITNNATPALEGAIEGSVEVWSTLGGELGPVADSLEGIGDWMGDNESTVEDFGANLAVLTAGFYALRTAIRLSSKAMRASPWGWAIVGISTLTTYLQDGEDGVKSFKEVWDDLVDGLGGGFLESFNINDQLFGEGADYEDRRKAIKDIVDSLVEGIAAPFEWLGRKTSEIMGGIVQGIADGFQWLYDTLVGESIVPEMVDEILGEFDRLGLSGVLRFMNMFAYPIVRASEWLYNTLVGESIFPDLRRDILAEFMSLGMGAIAPWDNIKNWVSERAIQLRNAVVGTISDLATGVKNGFRDAVEGAQQWWSRLPAVAREPVAHVVNGVYNEGIVPVWNFVAGKVTGLSTLDEHAFQTGGMVDLRGGAALDGYSATDDTLAMVRSGEGVLVPRAVDALGGQSFIDAANSGDGRGAARIAGMEGFDKGGIISRAKSFLAKGKNHFTDGVMEAANSTFDPILDGVRNRFGAGDGFSGAGYHMSKEWIGRIKDVIREHKSTLEGGDGMAVVKEARKNLGMPDAPNKFSRRFMGGRYPWCGAFVGGNFQDANAFDALDKVANVKAVRSYRSLSKVSLGNAKPGDLPLYRGDDGHINILEDPETGTTLGGNESRTSGRSHGYARQASSIRRPEFAAGGMVDARQVRQAGGLGELARIAHQDQKESPNPHSDITEMRDVFAEPKTFDSGGYLDPGWTLAYNGTGEREPVNAEPIRIVIDLEGGDAELRRRVRKITRIEGGGNVQVAFGKEGR